MKWLAYKTISRFLFFRRQGDRPARASAGAVEPVRTQTDVGEGVRVDSVLWIVCCVSIIVS